MIDHSKHYTSSGTFSQNTLPRLFAMQGRKIKGRYIPMCVSQHHKKLDYAIKNLIVLGLEILVIERNNSLAKSVIEIIELLDSVYSCKLKSDVDSKFREIDKQFSYLNLLGINLYPKKSFDNKNFEHEIKERMARVNHELEIYEKQRQQNNLKSETV